jgi:peptidyl-prolyl cis-trans isomerase B (cyclophilin B)
MPRRCLPLLAACLALAACGGGQSSSSSSRPAAGGQTADGCRRVAQPPPKTVHPPKPAGRLDPSRPWTATVRTSCGTFTIALAAKAAPRTTASFASLARHGFYDRTMFHRVVPGFVIQGGDPKGTGTGGPGYTVVEAPPRRIRYRQGTVAMAKTQFEAAGTSGSQFFVVTGADAGLPPEYALLGKVSGGQAAVDRIAGADADAKTGKPASPIVIDSITVAAG